MNTTKPPNKHITQKYKLEPERMTEESDETLKEQVNREQREESSSRENVEDSLEHEARMMK